MAKDGPHRVQRLRLASLIDTRGGGGGGQQCTQSLYQTAICSQSSAPLGNASLQTLCGQIRLAVADSMQGATEDVVILSLARDGFGSPGFLADWARVNVATTRECVLSFFFFLLVHSEISMDISRRKK